jgi:hypothetical protein
MIPRRQIMPARRWVATGACLGCGRVAWLPHTSDCSELAAILKRAKEDNTMATQTDETLAATRSRDEAPIFLGWDRASPERLVLQRQQLAQAFGYASPFAESLARQRMLMLGSTADQNRANEAQQKADVAATCHATPQVAAYARRIKVLEGLIDLKDRQILRYVRAHESDRAAICDLRECLLAADSALYAADAQNDALLALAPAAAREMQYEDLFGAQSMTAACATAADDPKATAMGRAIGATLAGWRPVV